MNPSFRSRSCKHSQCFDLESFLQYYIDCGIRDQSKWTCPLCKFQNCNVSALYIDSLLLSLFPEIPESSNKIVISEEGKILVQEKVEENSEIIDLTEETQNSDDILPEKRELNLENETNSYVLTLKKQIELLQQEKDRIQKENEKLKEKTKCSVCLEKEKRV